jgi:hypothetical protein
MKGKCLEMGEGSSVDTVHHVYNEELNNNNVTTINAKHLQIIKIRWYTHG